jgi:peptide/nickel transport system permease protein
MATAEPPAGDARADASSAGRRRTHPVRQLLIERTAFGILTLFLVSIIVFAATEVLPGNAAYAVLGHSATPASLHALEHQLGLDRSAPAQYWSWLTGLLQGHPGMSLVAGGSSLGGGGAAQESVASIVGPRLGNSAFLVLIAGALGTVIGVSLGLWTAIRRDRFVDHALSVTLLGVAALPEFVVGIVFVLLFASVVIHLLPGVSVLSPGEPPWQEPKLLILPVATLVVVTIPYAFRMSRAATIEALESDYVEMARLKGLSTRRVLLRHALPNAIAPTVQVIGLNFLYLAGGIVVVEVVFDYPGIGQGLVNAVSDRDIPTIQFIVILLAAFYVFINILTDVVALIATPRRRLAR